MVIYYDQIIKLAKKKKKVKFTHIGLNRPISIKSTSVILLDLMITNEPDIITSLAVPSPMSDLELISAALNINKPIKQPVYKTFNAT